ncbi:AraC family transcriptional regulator [Pseudomonas sp. PNP]|uniref:AraC family transcriptional regulator n=1 Tax=Pseudomonas sp. PNP TaxID=361819 RepID=UPI001AED0412|nr:AraC family transcriptional regulator [Pseudomonas sp. PNP]MBP2839270.1 AraC family transcriptional regulator [Pseudomonas sp. PNP]
MFQPDIADEPGHQRLARLAMLMAHHVPAAGDVTTAFPGLSLHRRHAPTDPMRCIYGLGLGVVAQGSKHVMQHGAVLQYRAGQGMLTSIDQPVVSHVAEASVHRPFLGMMLTLDVSLITRIAADMRLPEPARAAKPQAIVIADLDGDLLSALQRLLGLLDEPAVLAHLGPLIQQEIIIRLLVGPHGAALRHPVANGSPMQQIAKVVAWLKQSLSEPLRIDELAERVHMSPSTFRQHFRTMTGVSPLQFHKQLRLQEARQLMLNQHLDAGQAAGKVGYESASQFSREYARAFGEPPQRDIRRMREQA